MTGGRPLAPTADPLLAPPAAAAPSRRSRRGLVPALVASGRYVVRRPGFALGLLMLLALALFSLLGGLLYPIEDAFPLSAPIAKPPSWERPFGTDTAGRDLLAVMIIGTILTMKVGLLAGALGVAVGGVLAFLAAYHGGLIDRVISFIVDVLLTVPGLLVLVVLASSIKGSVDTTVMALVIAALAWREPTRQIRAQVLVMREAPYVVMAKLSGAGSLKIIMLELVPNLLPYLGACFVAAVSAAVLASIGLEALGLGSGAEPTLGVTVYWLMKDAAFMRGLWWWILEPVAVLIILFVALYLVTSGLDELANPRLRSRSA